MLSYYKCILRNKTLKTDGGKSESESNFNRDNFWGFGLGLLFTLLADIKSR